MYSPGNIVVEGATQWRTFGGLRLREVCYRADSAQPLHRHAKGAVSLVLAGELEESSAGATHRAAAGSLVVKPAEYRHANTYGPRGARVVQVTLADGRAPCAAAPRAYQWFAAPRLACCVLALLEDRPGAVEAAEIELFEAMGQTDAEANNATSHGRPRWWPVAVDAIEQCTSRSISVASVAAQVGVHPVHLTRVCRRQFGCTVQQYVRQRRVLAAWRACDRDDTPLATVALEAGFADQSHMTRAFVAVLGTSPGRLRRLATRPLAS